MSNPDIIILPKSIPAPNLSGAEVEARGYRDEAQTLKVASQNILEQVSTYRDDTLAFGALNGGFAVDTRADAMTLKAQTLAGTAVRPLIAGEPLIIFRDEGSFGARTFMVWDGADFGPTQSLDRAMTPAQTVPANTSLWAVGRVWAHPEGAQAPNPLTASALRDAGFLDDLARFPALKRSGFHFQIFATLPNKSVFDAGGLKYMIDDSVTLENSAANDYGIAGIVPFGDVTPEHYGVNDNTVDCAPAFQRALDNNKHLYLDFKTYRLGAQITLNQEGNAIIGKGSHQNGNISLLYADHLDQNLIQVKARSAWVQGIKFESGPNRRENGNILMNDILSEQDDGQRSRSSRARYIDLWSVYSPGNGFILIGGQEMMEVDTLTIQDAKGHPFYLGDGGLFGREDTTIAPFVVRVSKLRAHDCGGNVLFGSTGQGRFPQKLFTFGVEALDCAYDPDVRVSEQQIVEVSRGSVHMLFDIEGQSFAQDTTNLGSSRIPADKPPSPLIVYGDGCTVHGAYISSFGGPIVVESAAKAGRFINCQFIMGEYGVTQDYGFHIKANNAGQALGTEISATSDIMDGITDPWNFVLNEVADVCIKMDGIEYHAAAAPENTFPLRKEFIDAAVEGGGLNYVKGLNLSVGERDRGENPATGSDVLNFIKAGESLDQKVVRLKAKAGETVTLIHDNQSINAPNMRFILWGSDIAMSGNVEVWLRYYHSANAFVLERMLDENGLPVVQSAAA